MLLYQFIIDVGSIVLSPFMYLRDFYSMLQLKNKEFSGIQDFFGNPCAGLE